MLEARGIKFHFWSARSISDLVGEDPRLVDRYFGEFWVRAISANLGGITVPAALTVPTSRASSCVEIADQIRALADQIADDAGPLDRIVSERLERAIGALRAGRSSDFEGWLSDLRSDSDKWPRLSPETRARAYRASAMLHLLRDDFETAADLLDEAEALPPPPDRCARIMLDR